MPLSDYDHIQAIRNRIALKIREKENELRELADLVSTLDRAPKVLRGEIKLGIESPAPSPSRGKRKPYNRNVLELVREYLAKQEAGPVSVAKINEYLESKGVESKHQKQYIRVLLRREGKRQNSGVVHVKDQGYIKTSSEIANEAQGNAA